MDEVKAAEKTRNATEVDRELERFFEKFLSSGQFTDSDEEAFQKLLNCRRDDLVQLPSVRGRMGWHRKAS